VIAAAPTWWSQRSVLVSDKPPDDYALANQGQLKNFTKAGVAELDNHLPGGSADPLHSLIQGWTLPSASRNDFAPLNLGQMKNVKKPFYDRITAVG
jgi:hypothetical protein